MTKPTYLRPLSEYETERSLVEDLVQVADDIRQIHTEFGGRPYRVFLVWLAWTNDMNLDGIISQDESSVDAKTVGAGRSTLLAEIEILPTPLVSPLTGVRKDNDAVGLTERGALSVSQISLSFSEDLLMGLLPPFRDPVYPQQLIQGIQFFWEIRENKPAGHQNANTAGSLYPTDSRTLRRKFVVVAAPSRAPYDFNWVVDLERADGERGPNGELP